MDASRILVCSNSVESIGGASIYASDSTRPSAPHDKSNGLQHISLLHTFSNAALVACRAHWIGLYLRARQPKSRAESGIHIDIKALSCCERHGGCSTLFYLRSLKSSSTGEDILMRATEPPNRLLESHAIQFKRCRSVDIGLRGWNPPGLLTRQDRLQRWKRHRLCCAPKDEPSSHLRSTAEEYSAKRSGVTFRRIPLAGLCR